MYVWYETDCHLPRALIAESGIPQCAAVVAAPILNEWGGYVEMRQACGLDQQTQNCGE